MHPHYQDGNNYSSSTTKSEDTNRRRRGSVSKRESFSPGEKDFSRSRKRRLKNVTIKSLAFLHTHITYSSTLNSTSKIYGFSYYYI